MAEALAPTTLVGKKGKYENKYAEGYRKTNVSKASVTEGEEFYTTLDLVITIKRIPEEHKDLLELDSSLSPSIFIYYDMIVTLGLMRQFLSAKVFNAGIKGETGYR